MKKARLFIFYFIFNFLFSMGQAPSIQWQKALGGSGNDRGYHIEQTNDGGYITCGYSTIVDGDITENNGMTDFWVTKMDGSGFIQWSKSYGSPGTEVAYSIKQTTDNGYILTGFTDSLGGDITAHYDGNDVWVIKLDATGTLQWQKNYGGNSVDFAEDIVQTTDGGYVVAGTSYSNDADVSGNHGQFDFWIFKLDASGNLLWQKCFGGTLNDMSTSILQTTDGGYIVAGSTDSNNGNVSGNHGNTDYWVVKLDVLGNIQWKRCIGGTGYDVATSIVQTSDNGYAVAGHSRSNDGDATDNYGINDYWIVKLTATGSIQWNKNYGGTASDICFSLDITNDNGYVLAGYTASNNIDVTGYQGNFDYWLVKVDSVGVLQWQKTLGGSGGDQGECVKVTSDGGFILTGISYSNDGDVTGVHGIGLDAWLVKLAPYVGIEEEQNNLSVTIFPNPSNGSFNIGGLQGENEIEIYNCMGELIYKTKTKNNIEFISLNELAKGVYFCKIINDKLEIGSGKIIVN